MSRWSLGLASAAALTASLTVTLTASLAAPAAGASAAGARPAASKDPVVVLRAGAPLSLQGHGFGHGRGMSQYGAEGAARRGMSAAQILAFYYPGTTLGRVGGKISVRITADTSPDTVVAARSGLVARVVGRPSERLVLASLRPAATQWRLRSAGTGTALAALDATGRWTRVKRLTGTVEFFAAGRPIRLLLPSGSATYRGALRNAIDGTDRDTVNVLSLQSYLRGVVAREMPAGWSPAALQAQAVAARTYAAYERAHAPRGRHYQTCDTTSCQVYGGVAAETAASDAAVATTAGQALLFGGQPAFTQFSSSSGGWTVRGTLPYQAAKADPYDDWSGNGVHTWSTRLSRAALASAWPQIGTPTGLQVLARDGNGDWGGRVTSVKVTGSKGSVTVGGDEFRLRLGLRSTWFRVG